jgi:large subunit ribosomal protein L10
MAMTKAQKAATVDTLAERLEGAPVIYLTNFQGLTVEQATELRSMFREAGVEYAVVKNTMLRRAMEKVGGYDDIYDMLHGPTAVAFSEEPAAAARVMKKFRDDGKLEIPALKGAHVDGSVYQADALELLAKLKSKDELLGEIVSLLQAPMANISSALTAQGETLAGAIRTIAEKEEA